MAFFIVSPLQANAADWKHYQRGAELYNQGKYPEAIKELERAASISAKASTLRKLAEAYEKNKNYQKAADTYYREAEVHRKRGDTNTYLAVKNRADALNTEISIYLDLQLQLPETTLAKYEPATGTYFGAYIEQDAISKESGNKYQNFNQKTGKQHSIFFNYHKYGSAFPQATATNLKDVNGALQLALEPSNLADVKDNTYLRQFAKDAKASGIPIFLRFASEMNGDWVPWHGNPTLYKEKFRLVAKVMKEEAPNVAMVWVPNSVPVHNIHDYYPGDDVVDWVGVNLYSVPYFNGNANQPAEHVNPLDLLDPIYEAYASRKPIMIGEYGASHFTSVGNKDVSKFAITKMNMFYQGLRMNYPRVKAVHWFSVDTLTSPYVTPDRKLNNFSLTVNSKVLDAYKKVVAHPYYLSNVTNGLYANDPLFTGSVVESLHQKTIYHSVTGHTFAKTYDPYMSKIVYRLNDQILSESNQYPFAFTLDYAKLKAGTNKLEAIVFDSKNQVAGRQTVNFIKGPLIGNLAENQITLFTNERLAFHHGGAMQLLAAPYIKSERTMVPLRFISESLGASVKWNGSTKEITIENNQNKMILKEGSRTVTINGQSQIIEAAPEIKNGTTFVPLRFISEQLGSTVHYDTKTRSINITY